MPDASLGHWRVGRHQSRNLYFDPDGTGTNEQFRGVMFDPDDGPRVAEALNGSHSPELAKAMDLLSELIDKEPCRYDHNHACQEHGYFGMEPDEMCPIQETKLFLESHGVDWENR